MLRILHTGDWHLGQSFYGFDRDPEHRVFLQWLVETIRERRPGALLITGDIFDSINPSATAQRRFFDFLASAHEAMPALRTVLIAGNHDAAARLEAPAGLFERLNIKALGTVAREPDGKIDWGRLLVPLMDSGGLVRAIVVAVPFLRPGDVPVVPGAPDGYLAGIREFYRMATEAACAVRDDRFPGVPIVTLGHCHLAEAVESRESERRIVIGGEEALRADIFGAEPAYVALGHLHKPQEIDDGRICYSGSPIPLSFSERDFIHRVVEVAFDGPQLSSFQSLRVPHRRMLLRIPEIATPIADVLQRIRDANFESDALPQANPFLEVRVLDEGPDPGRRRAIEQALEGKPVRLASIKLESRQQEPQNGDFTDRFAQADPGLLDPEAIMRAAYFDRYQSEPEPAVLAALREILSDEAANAL